VTKIDFSIGRVATLACLLEVAAAKPGNVHRGADFEDVTLTDFMTSAVVLGQTIDEMAENSVGPTIHLAINRTRQTTGRNTNLGIVLLTVPLAKAAATGHQTLSREAIAQGLKGLTPTDGREVFAAINAANPGGLGNASEMDVQDAEISEGLDLINAMRLAADRDLVARQYTNDFEQVFERGVPLLVEGVQRLGSVTSAIVFAHVTLMAEFPDSLIARKNGVEIANQSRMRAAKVLETLSSAGSPSEQELESYWSRVGQLDFWLRSDGHKRNPGTTADLIAASLFVAIYNGELEPPFR
jgi:triphosphoribosyl-dephospho-CoA synthase